MKRLFVVITLALAAALIVGGIDRRSAVVTAMHERAAAEKKADVTPADGTWMRLPLECTTWIAKCGAGQVCKQRYTCAADLTTRAAQ